MKSRTKTTTLAAGVLALGSLIAAPSFAADGRFSEWDTNKDGTIDRDEFQAGAAGTGYYEKWRGEEPALTRQDWRAKLGEPKHFSEGQQAFDADDTFKSWDADQDERLKEHEMGEGWFQTYDRDRNEDLNEEEFGMFEEDADSQGWFE